MTPAVIQAKKKMIMGLDHVKLSLYVRELNLSSIEKEAKEVLLNTCDARHEQLLKG